VQNNPDVNNISSTHQKNQLFVGVASIGYKIDAKDLLNLLKTDNDNNVVGVLAVVEI